MKKGAQVLSPVPCAMGETRDPETPTKAEYTDWGQPFRSALARGFCHGAAAFMADAWERQHKRNLGVAPSPDPTIHDPQPTDHD